jgi:hydrogenase maturation factor
MLYPISMLKNIKICLKGSQMGEDEIQQQLQKIQEKNCKQDESMNEVFEKFERLTNFRTMASISSKPVR